MARDDEAPGGNCGATAEPATAAPDNGDTAAPDTAQPATSQPDTAKAATADPDNRATAEPATADRFAAWVRPSLLAMTRLARRLAPDHDAEDVVQEALERAWRKWDLFDPERGSPTVWLLAILADRARKVRHAHVRRLRAVADHAGDVPPADSTPVTDPYQGLEEDWDLENAIGTLPERQRLAVALYYFLDLSVADVATVMGCSAGTVKSTLFDARSALREALGGDDDDDR